MKKHGWIVLVVLLLGGHAHSRGGAFLENRGVPIYMAVQGAAMMAIWVPLFLSPEFDNGFFNAEGHETLLWPHVVAEYMTGTALILGSVGLLTDQAWAKQASMLGLGGLAYTSLSSNSWTFASSDRYVFAIPLILSLTGASISIAVLF